MSTETKETKGRFSWVITILELIIIVAYLAIGFKGIFNAAENMDFAGIFESVYIDIWFLIIAIAIVTILCFVPIFKSKANVKWAIWNVIWIAFSIYSLI